MARSGTGFIIKESLIKLEGIASGAKALLIVQPYGTAEKAVPLRNSGLIRDPLASHFFMSRESH